MRRHLFVSSLVSVVGLGCVKVVPTFEQSNAYMLEQTVDEVDITAFVKDALPEGASLTLVPTGVLRSYDPRQLAAIEDQLVQQLVNGGFDVRERQRDLTTLILEEEGLVPILEGAVAVRIAASDGVQAIVLDDADQFAQAQEELRAQFDDDRGLGLRDRDRRRRRGVDADSGADAEPEPEAASVSARDLTEVLQEISPEAEYFITYRIQEYGLVYREVPEDLDIKDREARVRIHARVIRVRDGRVLSAENIDATRSDQVRRELVRTLANYHYDGSYYAYRRAGLGRVALGKQVPALYLAPFVARASVGWGPPSGEGSPQTLMAAGQLEWPQARLGVEVRLAATMSLGAQYEYPYRLFPRLTIYGGAGVKAVLDDVGSLDTPLILTPRAGAEYELIPHLSMYVSGGAGLTLQAFGDPARYSGFNYGGVLLGLVLRANSQQ